MNPDVTAIVTKQVPSMPTPAAMETAIFAAGLFLLVACLSS